MAVTTKVASGANANAAYLLNILSGSPTKKTTTTAKPVVDVISSAQPADKKTSTPVNTDSILAALGVNPAATVPKTTVAKQPASTDPVLALGKGPLNPNLAPVAQTPTTIQKATVPFALPDLPASLQAKAQTPAAAPAAAPAASDKGGATKTPTSSGGSGGSSGSGSIAAQQTGNPAAAAAPDFTAALQSLISQYQQYGSFTPVAGQQAQVGDTAALTAQLNNLINQYNVGTGYTAKTADQIKQQATSEYQSYYDQLRLAANQAASTKDLALLLERAGLQDSYDKQRKQSEKDYTKAYIAADNYMLQRGMQRSSYGAQTLANLDAEAAEAQQAISDAQTAAEGNIDAQRYQVASQLAEQLMGYDANMASDVMKRTFQLQDQEYDRSTADKQYRDKLASDIYSKTNEIYKINEANSQWAQQFNESQRQSDNALNMQNMQVKNSLASDIYNKLYQSYWDTTNYNEGVRQFNVLHSNTTPATTAVSAGSSIPTQPAGASYTLDDLYKKLFS